jgi:hypothetical protein
MITEVYNRTGGLEHSPVLQEKIKRKKFNFKFKKPIKKWRMKNQLK